MQQRFQALFGFSQRYFPAGVLLGPSADRCWAVEAPAAERDAEALPAWSPLDAEVPASAAAGEAWERCTTFVWPLAHRLNPLKNLLLGFCTAQCFCSCPSAARREAAASLQPDQVCLTPYVPSLPAFRKTTTVNSYAELAQAVVYPRQECGIRALPRAILRC